MYGTDPRYARGAYCSGLGDARPALSWSSLTILLASAPVLRTALARSANVTGTVRGSGNEHITRLAPAAYLHFMRQRLLAVLCLAPSVAASAQMWCPPGATWTYGTDMFGLYGYGQYTYVSDTLLNGQLGHRIDGQGAMSIFGQTQVDHWTTPIAFITGTDGDLVTIWSGADQVWDTLFWMGAVPGDAWLRPDGPFGPCDPADSLVVIDTTTVLIDGLPLRRWVVEQRSSDMGTSTTDFTERIGWFWNFIPYPACTIVDGPIGLRCYSDQDISVSYQAFGCNSLAGVDETAIGTLTKPAPNPGTDHFALQLPSGDRTIEIFDATGRRV